MVVDVIEPWIVLGSDVIELIIVVSDVIEPMIVGGFRRYHHASCYWHYLRCNSGDLVSTSSQMCGSWNLPMFLCEGWVIHSDKNCFFNVSGNTIVLPSHNTKIVQGYFMACGVLVVHDG